ncbi:hypothetical protein M2352_000308 [Azospirillum fermentarium]|nr:hypothetical protein [Azospirillum fermentarium]
MNRNSLCPAVRTRLPRLPMEILSTDGRKPWVFGSGPDIPEA